MRLKGDLGAAHFALSDRLDGVAYQFLADQLGIQPQGTWSERWTPQRKLAVVMVARQIGDKTEELCQFLKVDVDEIRLWEKRYQEHGLDALRANCRLELKP